MRIIAGEFKGRRIAPPPDRATRPMLDRVREALFSTLGDMVPEARVLDLFAGTGSLGFEALSRGAAHVRFVEREQRALALLRTNVEAFGVQESVRVVKGDALDPARFEECDVAFLDPPYPLFSDPPRRARLVQAIAHIATRDLAGGGVLVLHSPPREYDEGLFPDGLSLDRRKYGGSALWYAWRPDAAEEEGSSAEAEEAAEPDDPDAHEDGRA